MHGSMSLCENFCLPWLNFVIHSSTELIRYNLAALPSLLSLNIFFYRLSLVAVSPPPLNRPSFIPIPFVSSILLLYPPVQSPIFSLSPALVSCIVLSLHSHPPIHTHYVTVRFKFDQRQFERNVENLNTKELDGDSCSDMSIKWCNTFQGFIGCTLFCQQTGENKWS